MKDNLDGIRGFNADAATRDPLLCKAREHLVNLKEFVDGYILEHLATLENQASWGCLNHVYERALGHLEASFVLISQEYYSSAEALCRTAVEASVNLFFLSVTETDVYLLAYFQDYLDNERVQNRKWLRSVDESAYHDQVKQIHRERITKKYQAIDNYEEFIRNSFDGIINKTHQSDIKWPSIFDRFKIVGKEVQYRTVYAALCSQAHNDSEDLLNDFVARTRQSELIKDRQKAENENFALYMLLMAFLLFIEGTAMYLAKWTPDSNETLMPLHASLSRIAEISAERLESSSE